MSRLKLTFLNTFSAELDQQPLAHFRSANNQGLLIYLILNRDQPVPREVLTALLWPEESEKTARHNLRQALYHLRSLLGDTANNREPFLTVTRDSARFNPQSNYILDVQQFLASVEKNDLETAVSLYQGDLLPGFTCDSLEFEDWLRQERESLHHLALEAMSELTQDYLGNGRFQKAQAVARRQLALEPWREKACRQLMRAYALAGERGSALTHYESCRETLWEELGIDPADETVTLYREIEAGRIGAVQTEEPLQPPLRVNNNLPSATTPLIGREPELAQIGHLYHHENQRLVTIVGPGGMGKTRLALAVGARMLDHYEDGVYFVDLAPLAQVGEIALAVAGALDYKAPDPTRETKAQLLDSLARRRLLLILDNFEHLHDGAAVVDEFLKTCPRINLLVTSRRLLNLASENRFDLEGLDLPPSPAFNEALEYPSVQLFLDSGRRAHPGFTLTGDNITAVVQICRQVQGMPLGIILAASWLGLLTPPEIAAEIERSLEFLSTDMADLPPRQRSMRAVFDRSWEMMTPAERQVFAGLSVFRGGFSREAAEAVAGANLRILLSLINKSLLQRDAQNGRFAIQELLRHYAAGRRRQADPEGKIMLAHCHYFARITKAEIRRSLTALPLSLPVDYAADWDNFRRAWDYALDRGLAGSLAELAPAMAIFLFRQGILPESVMGSTTQILQQRGFLKTDKSMLRLRLIELDFHYAHDPDMDRLNDLFEEYIPLIDEADDLATRFWIFELLWDIYTSGPNIELLRWSAAMKKTAAQMEDDLLANLAEAYRLCTLALLQLNDEAGLERMQALLTYFEPNFSDSFIVYVICLSLCEAYGRTEAFDLALQFGMRALKVSQSWRDLFWISTSFGTLGEVYMQMNLPYEAGKQIEQTLEWHKAIGEVWQTIGAIWGTATGYGQRFFGPEMVVLLLSMVYHHPEAVPLYRRSIEYFRPQLEEDLGEIAFNAAWDRGKEMDLETAVALIRATAETES